MSACPHLVAGSEARWNPEAEGSWLRTSPATPPPLGEVERARGWVLTMEAEEPPYREWSCCWEPPPDKKHVEMRKESYTFVFSPFLTRVEERVVVVAGDVDLVGGVLGPQL